MVNNAFGGTNEINPLFQNQNNDDSSSLLDDLNAYFDNKGREQDEARGVTVIRSSSSPNNANLELFYKKLAELGINLDEAGEILECEDNLLVLSGAGAGKTTVMILKIIRDLISGNAMKVVTVDSVYGQTQVQVPAKILVATFLKTGAEELKAAFHEWCQRLGVVGVDYSNIHFKTIHAEVKDALQQMGVKVEVLENTDSMIRSVMNKYGIRSVNSTSRSLTIDEVSDMTSIISYARNRLDNERYNQPLMSEYRLDSILLDAVLKDLKIQRMATGKMDFEDMQEMLLEALQINPHVRKFIADRYDYIYVDEFQDTSQLQYEILKYYFVNSRRVVVIGDDDQLIYSWRGSDIDIIARKFEEDMKPTVLKLTTNYRCKSNILNAVIPSIEKNTKRHPKQLRAYREGGELNVVMNGNVNMLIDSIKKDLAKGYNVGVLARVNADLLIPAIILELDGGIDFSLSKSVNMEGRLVRQVFGAIDLITKRLTEEFESYLRMFLPRYNWVEAEKLYNVLISNKSLNLYNIPMQDLMYSVPNLAPFIKGLRSAREMGGVEAYLYILGVMENHVFTGKTLYAQKARTLVNFVKRIILEHKNVKDLSIGQIDQLFNITLPERLSRRIKYNRNALVKLTTVHEAKGKEWDSVYIWNNVNGTFPNQVGNREITKEELEEERRVHYIAWTRAKEKLTVYSDESNPGLFLQECDLSTVGAKVEKVGAITDMNKVFKKANHSTQSIQTMQTDKLLREYIADVTNSGGITDERLVNMDIVLNNYEFDELVEKIEQEYGLHLTSEHRDEVLDSFFRDLADKIFNEGNFKN